MSDFKSTEWIEQTAIIKDNIQPNSWYEHLKGKEITVKTSKNGSQYMATTEGKYVCFYDIKFI